MRKRNGRKRRVAVRRSARQIAGPITDTLRGKVYEADGYTCVYCGYESDLSVDHVVPVVQGGVTSFANSVTACRFCNSRKGGRTPEEAGMTPMWGRFWKPDMRRYLQLMKFFGRRKGVPEKRILEEAREQGMSKVELAYAYSRYRNWSVGHCMDYLMRAYPEIMRGK